MVFNIDDHALLQPCFSNGLAIPAGTPHPLTASGAHKTPAQIYHSAVIVLAICIPEDVEGAAPHSMHQNCGLTCCYSAMLLLEV